MRSDWNEQDGNDIFSKLGEPFRFAKTWKFGLLFQELRLDNIEGFSTSPDDNNDDYIIRKAFSSSFLAYCQGNIGITESSTAQIGPN